MNWLTNVFTVLFNQRQIMSALTDLQAAVATNTATIATAVQTIAALRAQVADLTTQLNDGPQLTAMATQLAADDATLTAA